jgi:hypothetical protein
MSGFYSTKHESNGSPHDRECGLQATASHIGLSIVIAPSKSVSASSIIYRSAADGCAGVYVFIYVTPYQLVLSLLRLSPHPLRLSIFAFSAITCASSPLSSELLIRPRLHAYGTLTL